MFSQNRNFGTVSNKKTKFFIFIQKKISLKTFKFQELTWYIDQKKLKMFYIRCSDPEQLKKF